jgi:hypothetical protein
MKTTWKVIVVVLATLGAAMVLFQIYVIFFLPKCIFSAKGMARSPNAQYYAVFEQTRCEKEEQSRSSVLMGKAGAKERIVLMDIWGTSDVALTWEDDSKLVITHAEEAKVNEHGPYNGWPKFVEKTRSTVSP